MDYARAYQEVVAVAVNASVHEYFKLLSKAGVVTQEAHRNELIITEDADRINTLVDFRQVAGVDLDFFFYYPYEEGFGADDRLCS